MARRFVVVAEMPNVRRDCAIYYWNQQGFCLAVCRDHAFQMKMGSLYVVIRPETEHDFAVYIPTLQSPSQVIVRCSENGC